MDINRISGIKPLITPLEKMEKNDSKSVDFSEILKNAIETEKELSNESNRLTNEVLTGEATNLHNMMIAGEIAGLARQLNMQVRNKVLDAYNEVMKTQL